MRNKCKHPDALGNLPKFGVAFVAPKTAEVVFGRDKVILETPVVIDPKMKEGEIHFSRSDAPCVVAGI